MRIDHIAFRVQDKQKTVDFLTNALDYKIAKKYPNGFRVDFDDGTFANCTVLEQYDKLNTNISLPWIIGLPEAKELEYHVPPEIFISEGSEGSIVDKWVKDHGSGLHHIAIQVKSIEETKKRWIENGWAEFASDEPKKCPGLTQIFTKPSQITGVIWELIEREEGAKGFCEKNVRDLMESTVNK